MNNKVIIYGYSTLGSQIAKILKNDRYDVIIIENDKTDFLRAKDDGYEVQNLTLLDDEHLINLGIGVDVLALFCVSQNISNNLFIILSARNLSSDLKIVSVSKSKAESKKMIAAGATKVLNPYELGALRITRYINKPRMLKVLDEILFNKTDLTIAEIYIDSNSKFSGKLLHDVNISKQFNIILLGIMDKELSNKFIFNTKGINHKIDEGDVLVIVGHRNDLEKAKLFFEVNKK